jgi:GxxExxY protein
MELYYPEDSYKIVGAVLDTYKELGFGYQEKYYYRAIKLKLEKLEFKVVCQLYVPIMVEGKQIGKYFLDFLIDEKIVLEIKVANEVYPQHVQQVLGYLKANNLKLGIIAVISRHGVITKRVVF